MCRLVRPKSRCDACEALKRPCIWGNKKILRVWGKEYREGLKAAEEAAGSQGGGVKRKRMEVGIVGEREKSVEEVPAPKKRATRSQASVKSNEVVKKVASGKGKGKEIDVELREEGGNKTVRARDSSIEVEFEMLGVQSTQEVEMSTQEVVELVNDVEMTQDASPRRGKSIFSKFPRCVTDPFIFRSTFRKVCVRAHRHARFRGF
jgi:hypothetical protein